MSFKFEKLLIWQRAMVFAKEINLQINSFPPKEKFNLSSQLLRASNSIALNIAEGSIGQSKMQFKKYMSYSIGSLAEVVTCLYKAKTRKYISVEEFEKLYQESYDLMNMMIAFRKKIV